MVYSTALSKAQASGSTAVPREAVETLFILLSPFAPHIAEEGWSLLGHAPSVGKCAWPTYEATWCDSSVVTMAVQVNGKVRGTVEVDKTDDEVVATQLAMDKAGVAKWIQGKTVVKTIYVPGRVLNFIVK